MNYEPAKIRQFLLERFNDEELNHLCFDYFLDVYHQFADGMTRGRKVQLLLEHCQKHEQWDKLVGALQERRPDAYMAQFNREANFELSPDQDEITVLKQYDSGITRSGILTWATVVLGGVIISLLLWGFALLVRNSFNPQTPVTTEVSPTFTPVFTPLPTKTPTSTYTPIPTYTPTPTLDPHIPPPNPTLHQTWARPADGMVMVYVPGGTFMMGSNDSDPNAQNDEKPQHEVALDSFWIDRTEITNAHYMLCVGDGVCRTSSFAEDTTYNGGGYPVVGVSWHDAVQYCKWADAQLPTEAQWEYAARGPDGRIYPWGDELPTCTRAQISDCSGITIPVGSLSPDGDSWVDAVDMAGNVWEWVSDWYGFYSSESQTNPTGSEIVDKRVLRGGSWVFNALETRTTFRGGLEPNSRDNNIGFRCVVVSDN